MAGISGYQFEHREDTVGNRLLIELRGRDTTCLGGYT